MEKRSISARAVLSDIRAGLSDAELNRKYGLSPPQLEKVFAKLIAAGVVTQGEIEARGISTRKRSLERAELVEHSNGPKARPEGNPSILAPQKTPSTEERLRVVSAWAKNRVAGIPALLRDYWTRVVARGSTIREVRGKVVSGASSQDHPATHGASKESDASVGASKPGAVRLWTERTLAGVAALSMGLIVARFSARDWLSFAAWLGGVTPVAFIAIWLVERWFAFGFLRRLIAASSLLAFVGVLTYWTGSLTGLQPREGERAKGAVQASSETPKTKEAQMRSKSENRRTAPPTDPHVAELNKALIAACQSGNVEAAQRALSEGAEAEATLPCGTTALMVAVNYKKPEIAHLLLTHGASPNAQLPDGTPVLTLACREGRTELGKMLVEAGANPELRDKWGQTALWLACQKGHTETVRMLLDHKADPNAQKTDGTVPLFAAANANRREVVELLLARGANIAHRDKNNHSVMDYAKKDVKALLKEKGAPE